MDLFTPTLVNSYLVFIFGVLFGSFFNVVLYRFHTGKTIGGRSQCLSCGHILRVDELIPVVSFAVQKGRCKQCRVKLSWQYPIVELCAGALAVIAFFGSGVAEHMESIEFGVRFLLDLIFLWLLLLIAAYDIKHKIIPDPWSVFLSGVGLVSAFLVAIRYFPYTSWSSLFVDIPILLGTFGGGLLSLPFLLIWIFSKGRAVGLGDAKLMFGLGLFFGLAQSITVFVLAFWIGAIPSFFLLLFARKKFTMKSELPFAPFLVMSSIIVYAFQLNIFNWTF
jgi:leader peptidase (prepilin peptidase)/N-methyltransferase